jgi:putative tryptophan/tyrosine transport system substrate-binding protein
VNRRAFMVVVGGALAWRHTARAQQVSKRVIGFLNFTPPDKTPDLVGAFRQGLSESGFTEDQNVEIEYRWVDDRYDLLPEVLGDLAGRHVAVIVVSTDPGALVAKKVAAAIPIVFQIGGDPVEMGLVASLGRPGGNLTGMTGMNAALLPKKLELLHQLAPASTDIAALVNPANRNAETLSKELREAAAALGLQLHILHAANEADFNKVFATLVQLRPGGLVIGGDPFFIGRNEELARLALRHAVPTISHYREFATAGGLMSYGGRLADNYHQLGVYVARILKGERPADLPVQQSTKAELVINLKTAKALGIDVPPSLLARADEVIE